MTRRFVSGLLLAAGASTRFGGLKQVQELGGASLVQRAVMTLHRSRVSEIVVVVGFEAKRVLRQLDADDARVVINPGFEEGLSSSLRMGVEAVNRRSDAVLICLADQPFVTSELLDRIIQRFQHTSAAAVVATSGNLATPPVLLSRKLFAKVKELHGDVGAKRIALAEPSLERVAVDSQVLLDIDTKEGLLEAKKIWRRGSKYKSL